ncbi:Hypothetical Protein FCC1311_074752 [Hondaea fermentalgiana]|uniref:Uncharacterized protein n=1 Tax=Hondaea fermentalgiana TaxID=2315210 RepID=A0A2R5GTP1_9STRA|nr:Hypothetical Protein FCC1311_074752 [Hondaea fermentalgiana]|eukprot:GBG31254.1 Hypothetical Protein FCC1311_074752 [Hondaea fermentalgiana]
MRASSLGRGAVKWALAAAGGVTGVAVVSKLVLQRKAERIREEERIVVKRDSVRDIAVRDARDADARPDGSATVYTELKKNMIDDKSPARMWSDYLALHPEWENYETDDVKMVSLRSYLRSLHVPGGIDLRKMAVTLFSDLHMDMLLPFLGHVPQVSDKHRVKFDDFTMQVVQVVLQNLISPVTLSALSVTMHKTVQSLVLDVVDPVEELHHGISKNFREPLGELPNPFNIQRDFDKFADRIVDCDATAGDRRYDETQVLNEKYLPGLMRGAPGIDIRESPKERAASRLFTAIMNRLTSNMIPYTGKHVDVKSTEPHEREPFYVEIELGGKTQRFDTPDGFLRAVAEDYEHEVTIGIRSLLTSFGFAFCVEDTDGKVYHVPLAVPMRTGLTGVDGKDIVVPMSHAGVPVLLRGPAFGGEIATEWYQDVSSMTGWQPYIWRKWPWHLGAERWHDQAYVPEGEWTLDKQLALVRACCVVSILSNVASRDTGLAQGGYGYVGVCLDSVAIAQAAVLGETTIFPLLLSGQARNDLLSVAHRMLENLENEKDKSPEQVDAVRKVISSILTLETDIDIPPKFAHAACTRLIQTLPAHSCFELVHRATAQARKLQQFLDISYETKADNSMQARETKPISTGKKTPELPRETETGSVEENMSTTPHKST